MRRSFLYFLLPLSLLFSCTRDASFPSRPITLICPWSAGGGTDRVSRQLAFILEQDLGVPVNVVNATGGGGVTGHTRGAVARPDGYTITMITVELNLLHWRGLTNITYKDYQPVMMVNQDPTAIFVRTDSEWETIEQLEASIRANPGKFRASGTAFGGIWHVGLVGWLSKVGLNPTDLTWIAMNGSAPALQELMAGGLEVVSCSLPEAHVLLQSGKVRCLVVMDAERHPAYPDVPTLKERGIDWEIGAYRGIAAPPGLPRDRLQILEAAVGRAVNSPAYIDFMSNIGAGRAAMPAEQFSKFLQKTEDGFEPIMTGELFANVERKYSAMFFPKILLGLFVALMIPFILLKGWRRTSDSLSVNRKALLDIALLTASVLFYLFFSEMIGFIITAFVMLVVLFKRLGASWKTCLPSSVFVVVLIYQLFAVYLRVPLPRGLFGW